MNTHEIRNAPKGSRSVLFHKHIMCCCTSCTEQKALQERERILQRMREWHASWKKSKESTTK